MGLPAFDTHAYVKRLKLVGFTDAQAEAQSELQSEVLSSLVTEKLVTKEDLLHSTAELKQEITALSAETKHEIAALSAETKHEIAALSAETKHEISHIKIDLIKWVIGIAFAQTALIFSVLKFLH